MNTDWSQIFLLKHKKRLSRRKVQSFDILRQQAKRVHNMLPYFIWLRDLRIKYGITEFRINNCDETPCPVDEHCMFSWREKGTNTALVSKASNQNELTLFACVNADGKYLPPLLFFTDYRRRVAKGRVRVF